jgi:hypothetical protein
MLKTFGATRQLRESDWRVKVSQDRFIFDDELEVGL